MSILPVVLAAPPPIGGPAGATIIQLLNNVVSWFQYLAGGVSTTVLAYGAIKYMMAHSPRAVEDARRVLTVAVLGLVVALLAPTIVSLVSSLVPSP